MRQYYPLMPANGDQGPAGSEQGRPEPPDYKVYRSRPGLLSRLRSADLAKLRERLAAKGGPAPAPRRSRSGPGPPKERPAGRRVLKWVGIAALAWLALSLLAFAVSSQIQKGKLADMGDTLGGNPFMLGFPQTVLVLGTDVRPSGLAATGEDTPQKCIDAASEGETPPSSCTPYRADSIMLVRAGRFAFRKLSIPRDTFASIPGHDAQKINAAYAFGGAKLEVRTVEQFLGIEVDQVAVVDFGGFRDFIDAIGGVTVDIDTKVCSEISGGADQGGFSLFLDPGEHDLNADEALSLARTRCEPGRGSTGRAVPAHRRPRSRPVPAGRPLGDQGPDDQHHSTPLQLHQGPDHRLERPEGLRLQHGRADHAPVRDLRGARLQLGERGPRARGARAPPAASASPRRSAGAP